MWTQCMKVLTMLKFTEALDVLLTDVCSHTYFALPGLLYYAGHGYENYGNSFMVPIDAPNPYRSANCLCVQNILKRMQEKETGLNVFLLDMCRKRCQGAEAFEIQQLGLANGIFMKFLKDRLLEDKKITVLLDEVAEEERFEDSLSSPLQWWNLELELFAQAQQL
ncbi:hypothetical protein llap_21591 [Limosa lapponica baueri]|uniref:Peptidase C14 caspase domain-containing protein n=1 Tax=Limosa lapponica baueri TaxID=1758121 RepID=A0A2I0T2T6_LIMLA|nr:hypothetical protein llap_21591 [Limosa lapponica baueri]